MFIYYNICAKNQKYFFGALSQNSYLDEISRHKPLSKNLDNPATFSRYSLT